MKQRRLFVYGSLAPGRPNEHVLEDLNGEWEPAFVNGTLHESGWGADMGFPGIVPSKRGSSVEGFLFTSDLLPEHWPRLDAFEGEAYERVAVVAALSDGTTVEAYVYAIRTSGSGEGQ